jgi:type IV pilus assembly protein PilQ
MQISPFPALTEDNIKVSESRKEPAKTPSPVVKTADVISEKTEALPSAAPAAPSTPIAAVSIPKAAPVAVPTPADTSMAAAAPVLKAAPLAAAASGASITTILPVVVAKTETKKAIPQPVVPLSSKAKTITGIEIFADFAVYNYKSFTMKKPGRLILDFPLSQSSIKSESVQINRFGVKKVRIGAYSDKLRLVFDASGNSFPSHSLQKSDEGLKIVFK